MFLYYNKDIKRTNVYKGDYMERLKNLVKDVIFILLVIIIFNMLISYQVAKTEYKTYEYTVEKGETLWDIATKICKEDENLYVRNVIKDIRNINNLPDPTIYKGQVIMIPIY